MDIPEADFCTGTIRFNLSVLVIFYVLYIIGNGPLSEGSICSLKLYPSDRYTKPSPLIRSQFGDRIPTNHITLQITVYRVLY
jgi:hypothetical protein